MRSLADPHSSTASLGENPSAPWERTWNPGALARPGWNRISVALIVLGTFFIAAGSFLWATARDTEPDSAIWSPADARRD